MPRYSREVFTNLDMVGSAAVIQGTISGVKLPGPNAEEPWTNVYFKEAPNREFILCATGPDILSDVFGLDFATAMIGKTIEVEGLAAHCLGGTGILVKLQHQIKLVGTGPSRVPAVTPPPFEFPVDTTRRVVTEADTTAPPPHQYDPFAPNYDIDTEGLITNFCNGMYDPGINLPDPFRTVKFNHRQEVLAEVAACRPKFHAAELLANRQATLHYCLTHFDYFGTARVESYDACFRQNDGLQVMCTQELQYRSALAGLDTTAQCPVPHPQPAEIARVKMGGKIDVPELPIPAKAPGMPPNLLQTLASLEPGTVRNAGPLPKPIAAVTVAAPTPAPAPAPAAAPEKPAGQLTPQQQQQQRQQVAVAKVQRQQACVNDAVKGNPTGGSAQMNAILACTQIK